MGTTAIGLGVARAVWQANEVIMKKQSGPMITQWRWETALTAISGFMTCWAVAIVLSAARSPRFSIILRRPGFVACLSITIAACFSTAVHAPVWIWLATGHRSWYMGWIDARLVALHVLANGGIGSAVFVAWCLQIVAGRWRPEPSWNDRLGRLIGLYFLIASPIYVWSLTFYF